jgi:hypothetical protein
LPKLAKYSHVLAALFIVPAVVLLTRAYATRPRPPRIVQATPEIPAPSLRPAVPEGWEVYVDPNNAFAFAYPTQFLVDEGYINEQLGVRAVRSPYSYEHNGCALLLVSTAPPGMPLLDWDKKLMQQEIKVIGEKEFTLSTHMTDSGPMTVASAKLNNNQNLLLTYNACFSEDKREGARLETADPLDLLATFTF